MAALVDALAVVVFTVGAFAVWGYAFWWAWHQGKDAWYHKWLLVLLTLFWYVGESMTIRLGKYEYPVDKFPETWYLRPPISRILPVLGAPDHAGWVSTHLRMLIPEGEGPPSLFDSMCTATSWNIPLAVVAIEAALVFGFFQLAVSLLKVQRGRWRTPLATGGLCGLLMVNTFAAFDPVVSTTQWCHPELPNPVGTHLPFGLWNWFTTPTHPGYWFGVPVVNYAAWFIAAAVFGFLARSDDQRPTGFLRKYDSWWKYVLMTLLILGTYVVAGIGLLLVSDRFSVHGQDYLFVNHVFTDRAWQIGWVMLLLVIALRICWSARRSGITFKTLEPVTYVPKFFALGYCLLLLAAFFFRTILPAWAAIFAIWTVTVGIATIALNWDYIAQYVFGDPLRPEEAPTAIVMRPTVIAERLIGDPRGAEKPMPAVAALSVEEALTAKGVDLTRPDDDD